MPGKKIIPCGICAYFHFMYPKLEKEEYKNKKMPPNCKIQLTSNNKRCIILYCIIMERYPYFPKIIAHIAKNFKTLSQK